MSGCSDEEISDADRHGYEGGSDDDDDDDDGSEIGKNQQRRRRIGSGFGKVVLHQFTKAKKQIRRIRSRKPLLSQSRSGKEEGWGYILDKIENKKTKIKKKKKAKRAGFD
ncbi:hypothetical protein CR513_45873, partial [Mucuna pruriens]